MAKKGLILVTSCSSEQLNGLRKSCKKVTRRQAWAWEVAKNGLILVGRCYSRPPPPHNLLRAVDRLNKKLKKKLGKEWVGLGYEQLQQAPSSLQFSEDFKQAV